MIEGRWISVENENGAKRYGKALHVSGGRVFYATEEGRIRSSALNEIKVPLTIDEREELRLLKKFSSDEKRADQISEFASRS